jgi:uroporphyrinogen-III synthase
MTGVGARALLNVAELERPREAFLAALAAVRVIVRGPKPAAVMRDWQIPVWASAPEPNTWRELLATVAGRIGELPHAPRVAVQEYGVANTEFLDGLRTLGAVVTQVPVYQWALPDDLEPLKAAVSAVADGGIDVVLLTTQVQLAHLIEVADTMGLTDRLLSGLSHAIVASIGPTTSEELRRRGVAVDLEASHPKMGVLVTEAAARAADLAAAKRPPAPRD